METGDAPENVYDVCEHEKGCHNYRTDSGVQKFA